MGAETNFWFRAMRYGWGWSLPLTWQGWLVLCSFVALLVAGWFLIPPESEPGLYLAYVGVLFALLIGICWLKGEPPRWRWGGDT